MEITKEVIEKAGLNEDQVKAISEWSKEAIASQTKTIEEKYASEANKNAENILAGAASKTEKDTGVKRNEGEKVGDYIVRAASEHLSVKQSELDKLKSEYEEKVKKASGTDLEAIKKQYADEKDAILKQYADYHELKEKATKADEYGQQLTGLKLKVAFSSVKPSFPDTVNTYESAAKWSAFEKSILEKYDIEIVEDDYICIDKENKHRTFKLLELVSKDETITELTKGRQQQGIGAKPVSMQKLEGIPFDVPVNASTADISKLVKEHVLKSVPDVTSQAYTKQFAELFDKIKKQRTAA